MHAGYASLDAALHETLTYLIRQEGPEYIAEFWGDLKNKFGQLIQDFRATITKSDPNAIAATTQHAAEASTSSIRSTADATSVPKPGQIHHGAMALFSLRGVYFGEGLDDRGHLLEFVVGLMINSKLTEGLRKRLHDAAINVFYTDLPHPPQYIVPPDTDKYMKTLQVESKDGEEKWKEDRRRYSHRTADGSNNNLLLPMLGMANQPYARTVPSTRLSSPHDLPDPGLVFDTLLRRPKGAFKPHPSGLSSFFFAFADLVIHTLFYTNHADPTINQTSSYVDLAPLYGNSEADWDKIRLKDGTGRLFNDTFADWRLLMMPPASAALLVLMSRNHNYIASKLLNINERGLYADPSSLDDTKKLSQDDRLFQTARLINIGFFMQMILRDYVGGILGFTRDRTSWRLDPLAPLGKGDSVSVPRGEGVAVSVEFNLMYRWHSIISEEDADWTEDLFKQIFPNKSPDEVSPSEFPMGVYGFLLKQGINPMNTDPKTYKFGNMTRDEQGRFKDEDLARILHNSTSSRAGAFQARGNPAYLRVIEMLGMQEARSWGVCTMNEFRKFMGLKPFDSFKEWNPDPAIYTAAEQLYKDIDNLELYVGLQGETTNIPGIGSSLCPGYTVARAILSDAVCLTRGDRFLTTEFTPFHLTNWGYEYCMLSGDALEDGSYGGLLTKALFTTLPDHFPRGSAYAHFPMYYPEFLRDEWLSLGHTDLVSKYSWDRPAPPKYPVADASQEKKEWVDAQFNARMKKVTGGADFDLNVARIPLEAKEHNWDQTFAEDTKRLIANKSITPARVDSPNNFLRLDIVKDVLNLLPIHRIAQISGLQLKSDDNPKGTLLEQDVYHAFASVAEYILLNFEPTNDWSLRERSIALYQKFESAVLGYLEHPIISSIVDWIAQKNDEEVKQFLKDMKKGDRKDQAKLLASSIFAHLVPSAAQYSQVLSLVVEYYADDEESKAKFVKLAAQGTERANQEIIQLVREALAVNPPVYSVLRTCTADTIIDGTKLHAGQEVFVNLPTDVKAATSAKDGALFPGLSTDGLLSPTLFALTAPKVLATIFGLKNLRKVTTLNRFAEDWRDGVVVSYIDAKGRISPFPTSLIVEYEA